MDMPDDDAASRITAFTENIKAATTIVVTTASKDYERDGFCCKIGDKIGLIDDELVSASDSEITCLEEVLTKVENFDEKVGMVVYLGKDASDDLEDKISDLLSDKFDSIEYQICHGNQETLEILIGLF